MSTSDPLGDLGSRLGCSEVNDCYAESDEDCSDGSSVSLYKSEQEAQEAQHSDGGVGTSPPQQQPIELRGASPHGIRKSSRRAIRCDTSLAQAIISAGDEQRNSPPPPSLGDSSTTCVGAYQRQGPRRFGSSSNRTARSRPGGSSSTLKTVNSDWTAHALSSGEIEALSEVERERYFASCVVQRFWRRRVLRRNFVTLVHLCTATRKQSRLVHQYSRMMVRKDAAIDIQAFVRSWLARRQFLKVVAAARAKKASSGDVSVPSKRKTKTKTKKKEPKKEVVDLGREEFGQATTPDNLVADDDYYSFVHCEDMDAAATATAAVTVPAGDGRRSSLYSGVHAASLVKIVEVLSYPWRGERDTRFLKVFQTTYPAFATAMRVVTMLIKRFESSSATIAHRHRIYEVFHSMLDDLAADTFVRSRVLRFCDAQMSNAGADDKMLSSQAMMVKALLQKKARQRHAMEADMPMERSPRLKKTRKSEASLTSNSDSDLTTSQSKSLAVTCSGTIQVSDRNESSDGIPAAQQRSLSPRKSPRTSPRKSPRSPRKCGGRKTPRKMVESGGYISPRSTSTSHEAIAAVVAVGVVAMQAGGSSGSGLRPASKPANADAPVADVAADGGRAGGGAGGGGGGDVDCAAAAAAAMERLDVGRSSRKKNRKSLRDGNTTISRRFGLGGMLADMFNDAKNEPTHAHVGAVTDRQGKSQARDEKNFRASDTIPFRVSDVPKPETTDLASVPRVKLSKLSPLEVARQLTLIEHALYVGVGTKEMIGCMWMKKNARTVAPGIFAFTTRFNQVSMWVGSRTLRKKSASKRAASLELFIKIAKKCQKLHNYNGMMEIIVGLQLSAVDRLKDTWSHVSSKAMKKFQRMKEFMAIEGNYTEYRSVIEDVSASCVPFIVPFLQDLVFIDNNPSFTDSGLVNWGKCELMAITMRKVLKYQRTPYILEPVPQIQDYLISTESMSDSDLFFLSKMREPGIARDKRKH